METVTIQKAKTELSKLIRKACRGEEIVIAGGKKAVVSLAGTYDHSPFTGQISQSSANPRPINPLH